METKKLLKSLKQRLSWLLPAVTLFIALGYSTQEARANFDSRGTYYFDNNVTNWSKVYFIIGRSDWSQAIEMSATDCDGVVSATSTWDNAYEFFFADSKCGFSDGNGSARDIASTRSGNYTSYVTSKPSKFMFVPSKASGTNISGTWSAYDNVACHLPEILSGSKIMCYGGEAKDWNQSTYYLKNTSTKADVATGTMSIEVSVGSTSYKFAPIVVAAGTYIHGHWDSGCKCAVSNGKAYIVNGKNASPSNFTKKNESGDNAVFESNSAGTTTVTFTAETSITEGSNLGVTGVSAAGSSSIGKTNSIKWYISEKDENNYTEYTLTSGKLSTSGLAQGEYTLKAVLYDGNIYVVGGSQDFTVTPACTAPTATQYPMTNNTKKYGDVSAPTITPATGAGTVKTVYYTGVSGTSYSKSKTLPTAVGTYKVTVDVNAGDTYCAKDGIELSGNFEIELAKIKLTSNTGKKGDKYLGDKINTTAGGTLLEFGLDGTPVANTVKAVFFTDCNTEETSVSAIYVGWWTGTWNGYKAEIGDVQFTKTGNWYVKGAYQPKGTSTYTYTAEQNEESSNTSACTAFGTSVDPYWVVSALPDATNLSATAESTSQINLSWTHNATYTQVMVVRYVGENPSVTAPTQGQAYSASSAIGGGTVVYNGTNETFNDTDLSELTTYTYYLYTVNNNYYAPGVSVSATTKSACTPPTITTGSVTGVIMKGQALGVTGSVTGGSGCTVTAIGIAHKVTGASGSFTKTKDGSKTSGDISVNIGYLSGGTEYTYKAYATVNGVDLYGEENTFTTCSDPSPVATATFNKGKGYPWEQGSGSVPSYAGYFGTNDDQRRITLETATESNQYQWFKCDDAEGTNATSISGVISNPAQTTITQTITAPGNYFYILKARCQDGEWQSSDVVTVTVPYPEMGITGPGVKNSGGWTESYASGNGKLTTPTSGNVWTGMFRISEDNDKQFMVIQRHRLYVCDPSSKDGWCTANNITGYSTVTVSGGSVTSGNITPDNTKFSSGDSVKIIVTMTAPNAYNVELVRLNKVRVAVKSWGNDNNTAVQQGEWWDLLTYQGPAKTTEREKNFVEDYLLPGQSFTATAIPYVTDGNVHRSVFLGWSYTEDGWNASASTHREVSMETSNEQYQVTPSGDINLYAHFAFISTDAQPTVTCNNVVVTASANSYADNIKLNAAPYNITSSIGYKIGESGNVTKVATTGDLITTWATGTHTGHPREGWQPVTGTLRNLTPGTDYNCQHILTKDETDYSAYIWQNFTTLPVPTITVSSASPKAYEVITLGTVGGGEVTWEKPEGNAYFVKDMKSVEGNTIKAESITLKAPAGSYTITATPEDGCSGSTNITVGTDSEICN